MKAIREARLNRRGLLLGGLASLWAGPSGQAGPEERRQERCPCIDPDEGAKNPLERKHLHICEFHLGRSDPKIQYEVTHYCTALGDGRFQCLLYDSDQANAKLIGIEYVISSELYEKLPSTELKYWHPHRFEIEAGLLTLHGVKKDCEDKLVKGLHQSWGKTWHTWPDPDAFLPLGEPMLMWSAEKEGSVRPELALKRDRRHGLDTNKIRDYRKTLFK